MVFLGNGDGTFAAVPTSPPAGGNPDGLAIGDFNGDGILDLAVENASASQNSSNQNFVTILLGNGDGTFQSAGIPDPGPRSQTYTYSRPTSISVGDLNGDGVADLFVPTLYDGIVVLLGNGDGTFAVAGGTPAVPSSAPGVLADFNGDGIPDLAVAGNSSGMVVVFATQQTQTAAAAVGGVSPGGAGAHQVEASYPGDGNYLPSVSGTVTLLPATATALALSAGGAPAASVAAGTPVTLTAKVTSGGAPLASGQVNFCDAGAAYCTDIHLLGTAQLSSAGTAQMTLVPGRGSHSYKAVFVATWTYVSSSSAPAALNVTGKIQTTTVITQSGSAGSYSLTAAVAGIEGAAPPSGTVSFVDSSFGNNVLGTAALGPGVSGPDWLNSQTLPVSFPTSIAVADFNGDGHPDLAVVTTNGALAIFLGNGNGTFTPAATSALTSGATCVAVADLNLDGKPDLAVALLGSGYGGITMLMGGGDGTFTALPTTLTTGASPGCPLTADFNGDGIPDMAVASGKYAWSPGGTAIYLGNGDGTFTSAQSYPAMTSALAVGDFNGDGIPDLVVTQSKGTALAVMLGNGDGTFRAAYSTTAISAFSAAVGDFDGDGKADLAVLGSSSIGQDLMILLGNGDGTFRAGASLATSGDATSLAMGDFNGDGKADLALLLDYQNTVTILLGNGDGTFTASAAAPRMGSVPSNNSAVAIGDFNGDGWSDLAVAGNYSIVTASLTLTQMSTATVGNISPAGPPASPGLHSVEASYSGDTGYAASVSGTTGLVGPVLTAQTIAFGALSGRPLGSAAFTVSATASSGLMVSFNSQTTSVCTVSGANGATVTPLAVGTCTIQATQAGNTTYAAAAPVSQSFQVTLPAAVLHISKSHIGSFTQGLTGAAYTITASNGAGVGPTNGTVTVMDTLPAGLAATAIGGTNWNCALATLTCTRSDALPSGASYPAIAVTVNVAANAASPQVNAASVSGGGSAGDSTSDSTIILPGVLSLPSTGSVRVQLPEWTWMGGSDTVPSNYYYQGQPGVYGTLGVPAPANTPGGRQFAGAWAGSGGNLWLFGGSGYDSAGNNGYLNDLWEYTPATRQWVWMSGGEFDDATGVYGTPGVPGGSNIPGGRGFPMTWTDLGGNLWLFGGSGYDSAGTLGALNDLWEFNPNTRQWAWIGGSSTVGGNSGQSGFYGTPGVPAASNRPGGRTQAVTWTGADGSLWLFGGRGFDAAGNQTELNDLWRYDISAGEWTWISGSSTTAGGGYGPAGVYGTQGAPAAGNVPGGRTGGVGWVDTAGDLWLFGGLGFDSTDKYAVLNDLWQFDTAAHQWTWISGGNQAPGSVVGGSIYPGQQGIPGTLGVPAAQNTPGSRASAMGWTDSAGNLWLFGGLGWDAAQDYGYLNDLWAFNPSTREWVWMGGKAITPGDQYYSYGSGGAYGAIGVPGFANFPGGREGAAGSTDSNGNLWLFGGYGLDANGTRGYLNDLWELSQPAFVWQLAPPVFSVLPGTYNSPQTLTLSDIIPGAIVYYTTGGPALSSNSTRYTGPIAVSSSETVQAFAIAQGFSPSPAVSATYTFQAGQPTFSPLPGEYLAGQSVTITDATPGATIYFTTDGSAPTASSARYTSAVAVNQTTTIRAIAIAAGYANSILGNAAYTIGPILSGAWAWVGGDTTLGNANCDTGAGTCGRSGVYGVLGAPAPGNAPGSRVSSVAWTDADGSFWLFGGVGFDSQGNYSMLNDLWEFNPSTREWAWMSGSKTSGGIYGSNGVYGDLGVAAAANIPGVRGGMNSWTDATGNLWLFGGLGLGSAGVGEGYLDDIWMFNTSTREWTWEGGSSSVSGNSTTGQSGVYGTLGAPALTNTPGGRGQATSWTDASGNFWLFGGNGYDARGNRGYLNDLWMFNPSSKQWAWMGGSSALGPDSSTQPGVYGSQGSPSMGNIPGGRVSAAGWTDSGGNLWLFGGTFMDDSGTNWAFNDLWEFLPSTREWVWVGGAEALPAQPICGGGMCTLFGWPGTYGQLGTPATGNAPGGRHSAVTWTDLYGNLWLFGGFGLGSADTAGYLNDLWEFNISSREWSWMGGTSTLSVVEPGPSGIYGTLGVPSPGNVPGGRSSGVGWTDNSGNLWLFGEEGYDSAAVPGLLNDLWVYQLSATALPAAMPVFSQPAGNYSAAQTVSITDATPNATIYYTTDATTPTTASQQYAVAIPVSATETLQAIAVASGYSNSPVAKAVYTVVLLPALSVTVTPTGNFAQGQTNATYTVTVSNGATAAPTDGSTVTVTENLPAGLTLVSMNGTGWNCAGNTCTRSDVLAGGASYPALTVTVKVTASPGSVTNQVGLSGGGSVPASYNAPTPIVLSPCAVTKGGSTNAADVQTVISEALGAAAPANDLNHDGTVNIVDVQVVVVAALGLGCSGS